MTPYIYSTELFREYSDCLANEAKSEKHMVIDYQELIFLAGRQIVFCGVDRGAAFSFV